MSTQPKNIVMEMRDWEFWAWGNPFRRSFPAEMLEDEVRAKLNEEFGARWTERTLRLKDCGVYRAKVSTRPSRKMRKAAKRAKR